MYELFYYPGNASLAPHFVLEEIGAPFELRLVDRKTEGQKDPRYLRVNPMGRIPALVDGDLVLFESAAICLHLADRHPEAGLAPALGTTQRAHLYKWLMFLTNTIQPDFMAFHYPDKHTTDGAGVAGVKVAAERRLDAAYAVLNEALGAGGPYLLGQTFSVADLFLLMLARWGRGQTNRPEDLAHVRRLTELVAERPSVGRALARERLAVSAA
jgi:glutathione S-transferase